MPRGAIGLVSLHSAEARGSFQLVSFIGQGKTIRGICEGDRVPGEFIAVLIEHFMAGRFPVDRLVNFCDFEDLDRALRDPASANVMKPIVRISKI